MDVKTVCLGVLTLGDASGYEIQKNVKRGCFQLFFDASYGSIYPALSKLTAEGMVTGVTKSRPGKPDKKVYSITPHGRLAFVEALSQSPEADKYRSDFMARMLFCELLLPGELAQLVEKRLAHHGTVIEELERMLDRPLANGDEFVIRYGRAIHQAAKKFIEENRHLVEMGALLAQVQGAE